jgi:hypothetical protein
MREIIQIMNVGSIHFLIFAHLIMLGGLENQKATIMMPKTSATVPKTTCDQTSIADNTDKLPISPNPSAKFGTITTKISMVCNINARTVRYPCLIRFFFPLAPLTNGRPKTNKNIIATCNESEMLPIGSRAIAKDGSIQKQELNILKSYLLPILRFSQFTCVLNQSFPFILSFNVYSDASACVFH